MRKRIPKLFTLSPECSVRITELAKAAGVSRSRIVEQLVMGHDGLAGIERKRIVQAVADSRGPSVSKVRRRRLKR